ncbi:ABC transporter permease [Robertmurraya sp. DFI.2.37]|uniref:ABC transporter permease n=1 Tax=Robertmurraya sp. DFI.2.37 TaxID=3031819 RepID=UPI00124796D7|nr:ABC transporter permease [Robertmurraya sp. DFI.2.37]MDF1511026.1 ABC transporter permease [Robertmurraya sp. DFI.2.37]
MHKNNNQTAIKRLSKRSIQKNRTRNMFAVMAIILTTYMIATVFSIGISFAKNYSTMTIRAAGTTASIFLDHPTEEQYYKIKQLDYIEAAGIQVKAGTIEQHNEDNADVTIPMIYYDESQWESMYTPAISHINGDYPVRENEMMLSVEALNQLGIVNPKLNMTIPLSYVDQNGEVSESFRLSGWFTNYKDYGNGGVGIALVSQQYIKKSGFMLEENGVLSVSTNTGAQKEEVYSKIEKDIALKPGQEFYKKVDSSEESSNIIMITMAVICSISLFIVLSGYLLIYNVIYISVAKDIRFYGMLKVIGTSSKQIRKVVHNQVYRLSFVAIPVGLALSFITSFGVVPMAMKIFQDDSVYSAMPNDLSFHPIIFVGTALFAFFTIYLSCRKPAKMASNVSPIEALRYTGVVSKKKNRDSTKGSKLHRMAFHNVFRVKKRAFLVFASLTLGILTLLSVNGFLDSLKVENYLDTYYPNDFVYQSTEVDKEVFDDHFLAKLSQIDEISEMEIITSVRSGVVYDDALLTPILKGVYYHDPYFKGQEQFASYKEFLSHVESLEDYGTRLIAVGDDYVESYNKTHHQQIDLKAFQKGETVIISNSMNYENIEDMIGKKVVLKEKDTNKETSVMIGGVFNSKESEYELYSYRFGEIPAIYVSEAFMNKFTNNATAFFIKMNVDDSREPAVKNRLKNINTQVSSGEYVFEAKSDVTASFASTITNMNILADSVSILLIFIGLLNFVNVMVTGVHSRLKELAVLESIGMTKKQVHQMLTYEGFYYAFITLMIMMTLGNAVIYVMSVVTPKIADYATFDYPLTLMSTLIVIIFMICLLVPNMIYRLTVKDSVTERLRETETN